MAPVVTPMSSADFELARNRLSDEIVLLRSLWQEYKCLFNCGPKRVEVLNFCASWFFGLTQRTFMREILLGIARLTDRDRTAGFENLTIAALLRDPALAAAPDMAKELHRSIDRAIEAAAQIRNHRNKYLAHLDKDLALAVVTATLTPMRYDDVEEALAALEQAFNDHGNKVRDSHMDFELKSLKSADALFTILFDSDRWKKWQGLERDNPSF